MSSISRQLSQELVQKEGVAHHRHKVYSSSPGSCAGQRRVRRPCGFHQHLHINSISSPLSAHHALSVPPTLRPSITTQSTSLSAHASERAHACASASQPASQRRSVWALYQARKAPWAATDAASALTDGCPMSIDHLPALAPHSGIDRPFRLDACNSPARTGNAL
ncbi:hypothetical protein BKA81DRAFT_373379 [Phyllosticta paracitricarpa]